MSSLYHEDLSKMFLCLQTSKKQTHYNPLCVRLVSGAHTEVVMQTYKIHSFMFLMYFNHIIVGSVSSYGFLVLLIARIILLIIFFFNPLTKVRHYINHGSLNRVSFCRFLLFGLDLIGPLGSE